MIDSLLFIGTGLILSAVLAVNILHIIREAVSWYRTTEDTVMKTHITLHELSKMIERRHGFSKT